MSAPTIEPTHETPSASEDTEVSVFDSLPAALRTALAEQGITDPTPVQSAVIPDAAAGHDVLGRAQTGSGKTLAFGLPVLARLAQGSTRPCHPRAVVIVPTRELATQVDRSLRPLANAIGLSTVTVYGGTPYDAQTRRLRRRADIVVATPGRLDDLFEQGYVFFDDVEVTVLDEADHLCDLGFYPPWTGWSGSPRPAASGCCCRPPSTVTSTPWCAPTCATRGGTRSTPTPVP